MNNLSLKKYRNLKHDLSVLQEQAQSSEFKFPITKLYPCYEDIEDNAGITQGHYFHQDLFIAQQIFKNKPLKHIDIGSRVDGFVAHVASFREIEIFDIRPIQNTVSNIWFKQMDIMDLDEKYIEYTDSISCLHALEHFGLGRYGDNIFFDGYILGFQNISKMLRKNGRFYFSVPLGEQRIEFHAHRIFSLNFLLNMIGEFYEIETFSFVDDFGYFHCNYNIREIDIENNCGCHYGCAIFVLTKK